MLKLQNTSQPKLVHKKLNICLKIYQVELSKKKTLKNKFNIMAWLPLT